MHGAGRPSQSDVGEPVAIRDHASEGLVGRHAVGSPAVQRRDQPVQLVALPLEVAGSGRPMLLGDEIALAPCGRKLLQHARLLRLGGVDFETVVAKPDAVHALADDFKGCRLLRNEQYRLAMRETVGDGVGDGLAFAGTRRAEQHIVSAALAATMAATCDESADSGANRSTGSMIWSMVRAIIKPVTRAAVGMGRRIDQVGHDRIALEQVGAVDEVLPHQVFGEGQRRERDLLGDFPALDALDVLADGLPDACDVDAGGVLRQFACRILASTDRSPASASASASD